MNSLNFDSSSDGDTRSRGGQPSEFVIQKEDFPALSTFGPNSNDKSSMQENELKRHASFTSSASDGMAPQRVGPQTAGGNTSIGSRAGGGIVGFAASTGGNGIAVGGSGAVGGASGTAGASGAAGSSVSLSGGAFGQFHSARPPPPAVVVPTSSGQLDPSNKYGLLGMLHTVIRPSSDSKKSLAMGCDLTSLGLNLNSAEYVFPAVLCYWELFCFIVWWANIVISCYFVQTSASDVRFALV